LNLQELLGKLDERLVGLGVRSSAAMINFRELVQCGTARLILYGINPIGDREPFNRGEKLEGVLAVCDGTQF
jgi:hypothetical protein